MADQVEVTWTSDPADGFDYWRYSAPTNWSPQVVPNNGNDGHAYRITIPRQQSIVDIDATVDSVTLTNGGSLEIASQSFTSAVTTIEPAPLVGGTSRIGVGAFDAPATANLGQLTNFNAATNTLQSGVFDVRGSDSGDALLTFKSARILRNAGKIIVGDHAAITDELGKDALRELAINDGFLSLSSFTALARFTNSGELIVTGSFVAPGDFINNGQLRMTAPSATLIVAGKLSNFDPLTKTLRDGRFAVYDYAPGRLQFPGADIVTNSADISIARKYDESGFPPIVDETGADALRNIANNTADGRITIAFGDFATTAAHFTNTGFLNCNGRLSLARGGLFEQFGGQLYIGGTLDTQGGTIILHGGVVGGGILKGNTTSNTVINPRVGGYTPPMTIDGNLTLGSASVLQFDIRGTMRPYGLPPNPRGGRPPDTYDAIDCTGSLVADGQVQLGLGPAFEVGRFAPASSDTFVVVKSRAPIAGSFTNAANGQRLATTDDSGSFQVNYGPDSGFDPTAVVLSDFQPNTAPDVFLNISTRGFASSGDGAMIGGVIITGSEPKRVIIRAIGPSLRDHQVATPLDDPALSLHDSTGATVASNDDWIQSSQRIEIERTGIPPNSPRESAIVATLAPGAYTAVIAAKNDRSGTALVEIYDLDVSSDSRLANISTRGVSSANAYISDDVLIGGVIVGGGTTASRIVVRALGPSLAAKGVPGALLDPVLHLQSAHATYSNDNWKTNQAQVVATGLAPTDDREAVLVQSLAPDAYTAAVQPTSASPGGVALVELYRLQ